MKLEQRYLVLKHKDIGTLNTQMQSALGSLVWRHAENRRQRGVQLEIECLVIEKDWPEYEPTLKLLSERMDGGEAVVSMRQDNERAAQDACNLLAGLGYYWTGAEWKHPANSTKRMPDAALQQYKGACEHVVTETVLPRKHNHYFKDVSRFELVDVYRILELFDVTNPAIAHAVKKLLVAGGRGAGKDIHKDIQEAIDTLVRWQDMRKEDEA